jgi:putative addiction module component (TIGR02574 family)
MLPESNSMATVDDAFLIGQTLNPDEKLELIARLWESIPPREWRPSDNELAELDRRWSEYESGKVKGIPWEEVRDSVRRRLESRD